MGKIIISSKILSEPINMMTVTLREVETLCEELGKDPTSIKQEILEAQTIFDIETILEKNFPGEIILDA